MPVGANHDTENIISNTSASGYFDVGNLRIQFGKCPSTGVNWATVTLPKEFKTDTYNTVITPFTGTTSVGFYFHISAQTTTTFTVRKKCSSGDSLTESFSWIAIGQKP